MSLIRLREWRCGWLLTLLLTVSTPGAASANWGENWGEMAWGITTAVPALAPVALVALGVSIVAVGARWMRRRP